MAEVTVTAELGRALGKAAARRLRREGKVPAVVYGHGGENLHVVLPAHEMEILLARPGGARSLVNLMVESGPELVMPRQIQRHAVRRQLLHLDLLRVSRDVAVAVDLPIHIVGESRGVSRGGMVEQSMFSLHVEGRPADLPAALEIDVTDLEIGDQLRVADVVLPAGITTVANPEDVVAGVVAPATLDLPEPVAAAEEAEEGSAEEGEPAPDGD